MVVCSSWDFLAEHGKVEHNATHNPKACPSWRKLGAVKSSFHHYTTFQPPPNGETSQLLPTPIPAPNMVLLHAHWYAAWLNYPREATGNLIIRFILEEDRLPLNSVGKTHFVVHSGPENLKNSRPKKLVKSNKSISQKMLLE